MFGGFGSGELTGRDILARATAQLEASPQLRGSAARDAFTLLLHMVGITRAQFYADPDRAITPEQQVAYEAAIDRRLKNEPIQYITGEQEFYGLALRVTPAVLIPRPETELLVEAVLGELTDRSENNAGVPRLGSASLGMTAAFRVLDVGTGSGAIAIALAHHLPHAHVTATDISPAALAIAKENAARYNLGSRIRFIQSDLLASIAGEFDTIVSNPPYVPETDRASLHPQVRDYEPAAALFAPATSGADDGLSLYRRLIPQARAALVPGGLLALEIGHGQRDAIAELLLGWNSVRFVDDLQRIPRVALARKL